MQNAGLIILDKTAGLVQLYDPFVPMKSDYH
jgi:hypothetical protein